MKKLLLRSIFSLAMPLFSEMFYGNPGEEYPMSFRLYTMCDYLHWRAQEEGLEYVLIRSQGVQTIDYPYKNGFRAGGGLVFPYDDWQTEVDWTRFYHNLRDTKGLVGHSVLVGLWMNPVDHAYFAWEMASLSWDLKFDTLDFDLLRVGFVNPDFSFTPRVGLKRSWIKQSVHIRYGDVVVVPNAFYDVRFKNDFRAIGPRVGFDTKLSPGRGFYLVGTFATALSYGEFHIHRTDVSSSFLRIDFHENIDRFEPMVQGSIGLEWSHCFGSSFRFLASVAYEAQIWWGQNQLRTFLSSSLPPSNIKANGTLNLNGLGIHARFDF